MADVVTKCSSCTDSDNDEELCIDGMVYGYCSSDLCYGVCELYGTCPCTCHLAHPGRTTP